MNRPRLPKISGAGVTALVCTAAQAALCAGALLLYRFTGYFPLLLTGLLLLLPLLGQLCLFLPVLKQPDQPEPIPEDADKKEKRRFARRIRSYRRKLWYRKHRGALMAILIAISTLAVHILFWKLTPATEHTLNYFIPVVLAAMFVLTIVLEKWCVHQKDNASPYIRAILQGFCSCAILCRIAFLLIAATAVICLLGLYDAINILIFLLQLLFVYASAMLVFSLAVRLIRKELDTQPELLYSLHGMGSNMNILTYLEENTGITMRSLWSLHLMKKLLPAAILGIALLLWFSTGLVQVESYQQGALFRFGKLSAEPLQPGFHLTLPWPLDQTVLYDTQSVNTLSIGYTNEGAQDNIWTESHGGEEYRLLLGGGEEIVSINLILEYRIDDLMAYIRCSSSPESLMQALSYEIITARTISTDLNTLLAADRQAFSESFRKDLSEKMTSYHTGLEVVNVVLESIHPPVEIAQIYQDMIGAGIDAQYLIIYAENSANKDIMAAKEAAAKVIGEAEANYHKQVGNAQAAVTEFMAAVGADNAYRQEYRFQKYLNALTKAYGGTTLIIAGEGVDTKNIYLGSLTSTEAVPETTVPETSYPVEEPPYDDSDFDYDIDDPIE